MAHRKWCSFLAVGVLAAGVAACGGDDDAASQDGVTVVDAWSRQPAVGQDVGVVYAEVENHTDRAISLVSAASPVTPNVELHATTIGADGTMTMQEQEGGFEIPAGGTLELKPGGKHIMLLDIDPAQYPSDVVPVTLTFDGADPVEVDAEVRAITDGTNTDTGSAPMDSMSMGSAPMGSGG